MIGRICMKTASDGCDVDAVVRLMRADESDVAHPILVVDGDHEAILVAADVEHQAVLTNDARRRVQALNIGRRLPVGVQNVVIPSPQRLLCIGILFPEFPERAAGDDSHPPSV